jgi:hypothetical protein
VLDGLIRDRIVRVCLQSLPERSAPSPIVWVNLPFVLLYLFLPLSDLFIEVSSIEGIKDRSMREELNSSNPNVGLPSHPLGYIL